MDVERFMLVVLLFWFGVEGRSRPNFQASSEGRGWDGIWSVYPQDSCILLQALNPNCHIGAWRAPYHIPSYCAFYLWVLESFKVSDILVLGPLVCTATQRLWLQGCDAAGVTLVPVSLPDPRLMLLPCSSLRAGFAIKPVEAGPCGELFKACTDGRRRISGFGFRAVIPVVCEMGHDSLES